MGRYILLVAAGGALGAICRYGIATLAARLFGSGFAWGTLLVNLAGCLLIGVIYAVVDQRAVPGPGARLFFMTGFLGALTTFSTYALESVQFARVGEYGPFLTNLAANNLGGIAFALIGLWIGYRL